MHGWRERIKTNADPFGDDNKRARTKAITDAGPKTAADAELARGEGLLGKDREGDGVGGVGIVAEFEVEAGFGGARE
jgi:hypothetical protein